MLRVSKYLIEQAVETAKIMKEQNIRTIEIRNADDDSFFLTLDPREQRGEGILYLGVVREGDEKFYLCQDIMKP